MALSFTKISAAGLFQKKKKSGKWIIFYVYFPCISYFLMSSCYKSLFLQHALEYSFNRDGYGNSEGHLLDI